MSNRRQEQLKAIRPAYDVASPPPGTRLVIGVVAARLGVTITQMASGAGISRTAIGRLLTNEWPARTDDTHIRTSLMELMEEAGATDDELVSLFHAHVSSKAQPRTPNRQVPPVAQVAAGPITTNPEDNDMLLPKQALTPQARRAFKLFSNPFDGEVTSDEQMFVGDDVAYVREAAWQCAQTGGFVAICGESGAGKTTVLTDLESRLEHDPRGVIVIKPSVLGMEENDSKGKTLKSADILHAIITQLDGTAPVPQTLQARTERAKKLLASSVQTGNTHLLVVEEAHSMPDATLKHLKRLHELRQGRRPLLGILLLAQPELKMRLAAGLRSGALREVAQRCEVVELLPLDGDLKAYLERRASAAGIKLGTLLEDPAIEQLRARLTRKVGNSAVSMCYPLAVNNLVTRALNQAADLGVPLVTRDVISAV